MGDSEFEVRALNLLAFPKNETPNCELTGARATVQLITPHCSLYFANQDLAEQAWFGIIKKISHLLGPLNQPAPIIGTNDERARRANNMILSKRSLIEFCLSESSKLLSVKKYQLAIPAAIQALKFSKEIDGDMSIEIVEPYLHLSQAYLGIKQYNKAEEYLSLARWIVLNCENTPHKTKSKLFMLLGRSKAAQGQFEDAKNDFANAILFSSHASGPESIATAMGYYRIGDVFLAQANVESALAYFDKVVDVWYKYLSSLHNSIDPTFRPKTLTDSEAQHIRASLSSRRSTSSRQNSNNPQSQTNDDIMEDLDEEAVADGRAQLEQILEHRRRLLGNTHIATGEIEFTIGLFEYFLLHNSVTAEGYLNVAHKIYDTQLGEENPSTRHVASVLELMRQTYQ